LTLDYSVAGFELDRTMRVIKMRGSGHATHPYRLAIEPGGLHVTKLTSDEAQRAGSFRASRSD
jgi:KaiC/GvpD/RAD55 family RecA-like ATPase